MATAQIVLQYNYCIAGSWAGWGAQAWALGAGRAGQAGAGRRASGSWALGERAQGAGACHAQARCRRTDAGGARQGRAGREAGARGARHERQARGRVSDDTAEGLLRHGASARSARGHARCHTPTFCSCAAPRNPLGQPSRCLTILSNTRAYGALSPTRILLATKIQDNFA